MKYLIQKLRVQLRSQSPSRAVSQLPREEWLVHAALHWCWSSRSLQGNLQFGHSTPCGNTPCWRRNLTATLDFSKNLAVNSQLVKTQPARTSSTVAIVSLTAWSIIQAALLPFKDTCPYMIGRKKISFSWLAAGNLTSSDVISDVITRDRVTQIQRMRSIDNKHTNTLSILAVSDGGGRGAGSQLNIEVNLWKSVLILLLISDRVIWG